MQRGRGGRDDFFNFGDPFGAFGSFGGIGGHRSLMSNFFGGRDPFDDPFFTRPVGSMFGPSMLGPSMFGSEGSFFVDSPNVGFLDNQVSQPNKSNGPVIQELSSDDEEDEAEKEKNDNPRKHSRPSKEPFVQDPDEVAEERKSKQMQYRGDYSRADRAQPQNRTFSFQSSTVTYGGANGAYYTSSTTRRTGGDGISVEESKEADTTTGKATHRLSRGIRDKGHSVTRKLNSDGKVDTMQMLNNLNEDELPVFEEAWKGNARKYLPDWNQGFDMPGNGGSSSGQNRRALPSTERQEGMKSKRSPLNGRV
ncbi:glycine-rich protein isoform X2 [Tasmannia lanceolata]|uniref:glycine-rich protein isoform X2 n=1 Tax=Tasmannia lanceolata TaxID=3420 RepID=UPI004062D37F